MLSDFTSGMGIGFGIGVVACCVVLLACLGWGGKALRDYQRKEDE